jgi:hypothetical protein
VSFHDIFVNQQAKRSTPFPVLRLNHKKEAPDAGASEHLPERSTLGRRVHALHPEHSGKVPEQT